MKTSKRNPSIELIRLVACLIVVACHVNFYLHAGETELLKTWFFCLFSDGVSIFFLITGCFLFQNQRLSLLWQRTMKKILFPVLLLFFLCLAASSWQFPVSYFDHTWYVFVYVAVLIFYPLLKRLADFLDQGSRRDLIFLAATLLLFILNDLTQNQLLHFGFSPLRGLLPACILILWGHILYRRSQHLCWSFPGLLPAAFFFLLNGLRTWLQLALYAAGNNYNLRVWHTSFGLLCAVCVLLPGLYRKSSSGVPSRIRFGLSSDFFQTAVCSAASYTFGIYLIHPLLSALAIHFDLWNLLQKHLFNVLPYVPGAICYLMTATLALFTGSFLICICLRKIKNLLLPK